MAGWSFGRVALACGAGAAVGSIGYNMLRHRPAPVEAVSAAAPVAADPEAALRQLKARVAANPSDVESWQKLGWRHFEAARYGEAADAYRHATKLAPGNATLWSSLGEAVVMASEHDPMPAEASAAFDKAVAIDAKEPRARYFLAVRKDLAKDHAGAIRDWLALLADTPPGAPWEGDLRRTIEQVGRINHIDVAARLAAVKPVAPHAMIGGDLPGTATAAIPGPSPAQMRAAAGLPKDQQDAMVAGMVANLEAKLSANPGNVDGWIMLMRSRMTLGEGDKAKAAYAAARAANPAQSAQLAEAARALRVPGA